MEWISVSDRLPTLEINLSKDMSRVYLIKGISTVRGFNGTCDIGDQLEGFAGFNGKVFFLPTLHKIPVVDESYNYWTCESCHDCVKVTHWMSLPK